MTESGSTDFGFQEVKASDKTRMVTEVFSSVASRYDLMNDLMSLGVHRLWKQYAVYIARVRAGENILDVAGGTGDLAVKLIDKVGQQGSITIADLNVDMLQSGRDKLIDRGILKGVNYIQANAECLPFQDNSFDLITIGFGLRNVTDKARALRSMYDKLNYGGRLLILEFSKVVLPVLENLYESYSFKIIPWLGEKVANDRASYQYLVESIRMHPDQETLKGMLQAAGFERVTYQNLSAGIVAIHTAYKI